MKIILSTLVALVGIGITDAALPTISNEGEDIVFDTSVMKWTITPSDACYFQAHKLDECWIIETVYDLGACIECVFAGQPNPNEPTCDIMKSSVIEDCAEGNCYGANFCKDKAMDFFNCVVDDECSDPSSGKDQTGEAADDDICKDEIYDFGICLADTDYDVVTCAECVYAGQSDVDNFSCEEIDCVAIGDCRDTNCDACEDEFNVYSNCALSEACDVVCVNPGDACYDETMAANSCASSLTEVNDCISCYLAGQSDPQNPTCDDTDCGEYLICLNEKCGNCVDEYMASFACTDEVSQCDVDCSDYRRLKRSRSHQHKPHHFRRLARPRKGPRVNGPRGKPH